MSRQHFEKLIEVVGHSFYYYTHMKEINISSRTYADYEKLKDGWVKEYRGGWDLSGATSPLPYNMFKPMVDQAVHQIIEATEDEISRRVNEILMERQIRLDNKGE